MKNPVFFSFILVLAILVAGCTEQTTGETTTTLRGTTLQTTVSTSTTLAPSAYWALDELSDAAWTYTPTADNDSTAHLDSFSATADGKTAAVAWHTANGGRAGPTKLLLLKDGKKTLEKDNIISYDQSAVSISPGGSLIALSDSNYITFYDSSGNNISTVKYFFGSNVRESLEEPPSISSDEKTATISTHGSSTDTLQYFTKGSGVVWNKKGDLGPVRISPDGKHVIVFNKQYNVLKYYDSSGNGFSAVEQRPLPFYDGGVAALPVFSKDSSKIAAFNGRQLYMIDIVSKTLLWTAVTEGNISSVYILPDNSVAATDGKYVYSFGTDGEQKWKVDPKIEGGINKVYKVLSDPTGKYVAFTSMSKASVFENHLIFLGLDGKFVKGYKLIKKDPWSDKSSTYKTTTLSPRLDGVFTIINDGGTTLEAYFFPFTKS
ncbi:MAG: hypothetical protein HY362_02150 [Candidatus Aenigmarchaeota archaeon]|nr:hypothetical protein [Candidatus Aenigmarchaeota archaeon]